MVIREGPDHLRAAQPPPQQRFTYLVFALTCKCLCETGGTRHELQALGVGFISLHEALDFTTPAGRALAGILAVFAEFEHEILRERVKAGIAQARRRGKRHGRPPTVAHHADAVRRFLS
ncbi:MAG: recombinase family protein [Candidatus Entotheonellia bacterium]